MTSSIVIYAVAAALALLFIVPFFVAVCRHKRVRRAYDVLYLVIGSILLIVLTAVVALVVLQAYEIGGVALTAVQGDKKFADLAIGLNGKTLLSVPYLGKAVTLSAKFQPYSVYVAAAEWVLCLAALIAVGAKTYRVKKNAKQAATEPDASEAAPKEEFTEQDEPLQEQAPAQAQQESAPTPDFIQADEQPEQEASGESVHNIVDEIDRLVTGAPQTAEDKEIDDALKRAILEGYALMENAPAASEEQVKKSDSVAAESARIVEKPVPETEETKAEETKPVKEEHPREKEEVWAFEAEEAQKAAQEPVVEQEPELVPDYNGRVKNKGKVIAVEKTESVPEPDTASVTRPASPENADRMRTRVRTIIRHTSAGNAAADTAPEEKPAKSVVAESGGLPLTRKYVILNRRSAATVFSEYLNSKREQEKAELTNSLNTIIMK